eukprot:11468028-Karenia_brevis.AAC.1
MDLTVDALLLVGIPCNLFIFLSSSAHQRTVHNPEGNESNQCVRKAAAITANGVYLCDLAAARSGNVIVEQPLN